MEHKTLKLDPMVYNEYKRVAFYNVFVGDHIQLIKDDGTLQEVTVLDIGRSYCTSKKIFYIDPIAGKLCESDNFKIQKIYYGVNYEKLKENGIYYPANLLLNKDNIKSLNDNVIIFTGSNFLDMRRSPWCCEEYMMLGEYIVPFDYYEVLEVVDIELDEEKNKYSYINRYLYDGQIFCTSYDSSIHP